MNATWWQNLVDFSTAAESSLIVGLNIHPWNTTSPPKASWDPRNAEALLRYAKSQVHGFYHYFSRVTLFLSVESDIISFSSEPHAVCS